MIHKAVHGEFADSSRYNLLEVIMIRLPKDEKRDKAKNKPTRLHSLLSDLFSRRKPQVKCELLESKYDIKVSSEIQEDINTMCNLSEMFIEEGMQKGLEKGRAEGLEKGRAEGERNANIATARNLKAADVDICIIASSTGLTPDEIAAL